jgi:cytochrome P450
VYKKLKHEIRSTFTSEDEITLARCMDELPYLTACIEENLRIFPPAPIGFLRTIQEGGDIIDGHNVPGGVSIEYSLSIFFFSFALSSAVFLCVRDYAVPEFMLTLQKTAVSVSSWCAHHSTENFLRPDEFIPERWLDDEYASDKRLASRPFSMGPRGCIGKE